MINVICVCFLFESLILIIINVFLDRNKTMKEKHMKTCMSSIFFLPWFHPPKVNIMISMRENGWIFNTKGEKLYCSNDWHIMITFISIQRTKDSFFICLRILWRTLKNVLLWEASNPQLLRPGITEPGIWTSCSHCVLGQMNLSLCYKFPT